MRNIENKRAFANKRNKVTAAEVRKHVISGLLSTNRSSILDGGISFEDSAVKIDVTSPVAPIDIEAILEQRKSSLLYSISSPKNSSKKIYEYPSDDVEVKISRRDGLTEHNYTTLTNIENHVRDICSFYSDDFSVINRKYHQFSSEENQLRWEIERLSALQHLRPQVFHCGLSIMDRVTSVVSIDIPDDSSAIVQSEKPSGWDVNYHARMLKKATSGKESLLNTLRSKNRSNHMMNFISSDNKDSRVDKRAIPHFPEEEIKSRLFVKIEKVAVDPYFEPLFVSMAIYDIRRKIKVTETSYFTIADDDKLDMLGKHRPKIVNKIFQTAFHTSSSPVDLFLVIKIDKVLQQCDVFDSSEPYTGSKEEKNVEKLYTSAEDYCQRLGAYRMPMGIQFIDIHKIFSVNCQLARPDLMSASSCTMTSGVTFIANGQVIEDRCSITSADRVSTVTVGSTLRRFGSGTSAASVFNRVRTPLAKRKFFPKSEENAADRKYEVPDCLDNMPPCTLRFSTFFKQESDKLSEDEVYKMCADIRKTNGRINKKMFNLDMEVVISGYNKSKECQNHSSTLTLNNETMVHETMEISKSGFSLNNSYRNLLYFYPKHVNFSNRAGNARNIALKIELMNASEKALDVIFEKGSSSNGPFTKSATTSVLYHQKAPNFTDEVKISLPCDLNDGHHLLFTFYHVSCKDGDTSSPETPIGYSWLPLYRDGKIKGGDFNLPVCGEKPPASYGYLDPANALPNIKWIDGHKPLFSCSLNVVSSVHAQDMHLIRFFTSVASLSSSDLKNPPVGETVLISSIENVLKAAPERIVAFLHFILSRLFFLIANPPYSDELSLKAFECVGQLVKLSSRMLDSDIDSHCRSMLLASFSTYRKISSQESKPHSSIRPIEHSKPSPTDSAVLINMIESVERSTHITPNACLTNVRMHELLAEVWLKSRGISKENSLTHAWFFLEVLLKSCYEYLSMTGRMFSSRKMRFSEQFSKNLEKICSILTQEVIARCVKDYDDARTMSNALAYFIRDSFSIMDRTFTMRLMHNYISVLTESLKAVKGNDRVRLLLVKMDFVRIICSYEHYLILNVLFESDSNTSSSSATPPPSALSALTFPIGSLPDWKLTEKSRSMHYLSGQILADLQDCLTSGNTSLCSKAIDNVKMLLRSHELDARVTDGMCTAHVASIYKPIVTTVLSNRDCLYSNTIRCSTDASSSNSFCEQETKQDVMMAISGRIPANGHELNGVKSQLDQPLSKSLLCSMYWVLKNINPIDLREWIVSLGSENIMNLLHIFHYSMDIFELKEESITQAKSDMNGSTSCSKSVDEDSAPAPAPIRWRNSRNSANCDSTSERSFSHDSISSEAIVSCEIFLCIMDLIENIILLSADANNTLFGVLSTAFSVIMHGLSCNVSEQVLEVVFAAQQSFVARFPTLVLEQKPELCANLCRHILHHCSSTKLQNIRVLASVSAYHFMRESFKLNKGLTRAKTFLSTALSALFSGTCRYEVSLNDEFMGKSLEFVNQLSVEDDSFDEITKARLISQVKDVTSNLKTILSSTVRMREHVNDYEMTIDLMYQLVEGYSNNPDLRITWLLNMAERHEKQRNLCEAAHCYLQASALSAEYIDQRQLSFTVPSLGASTFAEISPNALKESGTSNPAKSADGEGQFQSYHFTEAGLLKLMEKSFNLLERAQLYELLFPLAEILLNYCHATKGYSRISSIHKRLSVAADQIKETKEFFENQCDSWVSPLPGTDKRCFGTFFRVAFYGVLFGDLNNTEFVYKETAFSKLNEISSRLETFYTQLFGEGNVVVLKDSKQVDVSNLEPAKVYLQITFVDVYLSDDEKMERPTYFERRNNVNRFFYETPYTLEGRAQGDVSSQYKKRTIVTVDSSFPYIKTRLRVINRSVTNFSPIEVAIEDIEKKTRELAAAIQHKNAKMLSMLVQGSIGTTVNQGPLEIAKVFLVNAMVDERGRPMDRLQNKLRLAFRHLQFRAMEAIQLSSQLIASDQREYQANVEANFNSFITHLKPMLTREKNEITFSEFGKPTVV